MLALMTLLCLYCGYVGWAMNWKRQREAFLKAPGAVRALYYSDHAAPIWIQFVGARGYRYLTFWSPSDQRFEEGKRLFPEAEILIETGEFPGKPTQIPFQDVAP